MRFAVLSAVLLVACGDPAAPPAKSAASAQRPSGSAAESPSPPGQPITSLKRAQVRTAVARGVGAFLQNVTFDENPVMKSGKFYGFVIQSINADWVIDLRPGDVVTKVNGIVPEHPDEADAALRSLEKATALKVEYEREGKPRTLELPIVD